MVTTLYACLAWLAASAGCGVLVLALDGWDRLVARRAKRKRRVDPLKLAGRPLVDCPGDVWHGLPYAPGVGPEPDPVEQAYADNGFAVDVEPAPPTDELPPVNERAVNGLLVEIYRAQTRARFKGIYGEDGQA